MACGLRPRQCSHCNQNEGFEFFHAMPLNYIIDHERNLADVRGTGKVSLEEALHVIRDVAMDVGHEQCGCLVDLRQMDFYPTIAELKEVAFEFIRLRAAFRAGTSFIVAND